MSIREQALEIKRTNPSFGYKKIAKAIGCAPNTVRFHLHEKVRTGNRSRSKRLKREWTVTIKAMYGSRCGICGYNKCMGALQFHHRDPSTKIGPVMDILRQNGIAAAISESKKCDLVCSNCHAEIHEGEWDVLNSPS